MGNDMLLKPTKKIMYTHLISQLVIQHYGFIQLDSKGQFESEESIQAFKNKTMIKTSKRPRFKEYRRRNECSTHSNHCHPAAKAIPHRKGWFKQAPFDNNVKMKNTFSMNYTHSDPFDW